MFIYLFIIHIKIYEIQYLGTKRQKVLVPQNKTEAPKVGRKGTKKKQPAKKNQKKKKTKTVVVEATQVPQHVVQAPPPTPIIVQQCQSSSSSIEEKYHALVDKQTSSFHSFVFLQNLQLIPEDQRADLVRLQMNKNS